MLLEVHAKLTQVMLLRTILKAAQPEKLDSNIYTHFDLIQFYLSLQRQNKHTNTIEEKTLFISYSLKWSEPIYISINTQSKDINNDLRRVKNRQIAEGIKDLKSQFYRCGRVGSISSLISLWFHYDLVVTKRHWQLILATNCVDKCDFCCCWYIRGI